MELVILRFFIFIFHCKKKQSKNKQENLQPLSFQLKSCEKSEISISCVPSCYECSSGPERRRETEDVQGFDVIGWQRKYLIL